MLKISRESEINLINILIDQDIISGKDLVDIKKASSEGEKSQIEAVFELKLTDEQKILDLLAYLFQITSLYEISLAEVFIFKLAVLLSITPAPPECVISIFPPDPNCELDAVIVPSNTLLI